MKKLIQRRAFLRGSGGIALGLPLLNCMSPARANQSSAEIPKRFLGIYMAHGFMLNGEWGWYPTVSDDGEMRFGRSMSGFNAFKDRVSVFHGLEHPTCVNVGGHCSADSFLTGSAHTASVKSPSLDQVAAAVHGHKTRYPSLVLGNEGGIGGSGNSTTLSYDQFGFPIASKNDIRGLYNELFNADPAQQRRQRGDLARKKRSVDNVLESYKSLRAQVGREDTGTLDRYLQALRDTEKEIERMERWIDTPKPQVLSDSLSLEATVKEPATFIRTIYDLIYLAFKTDSTRYATYMLMSMSSSPWDNIPQTLGLGKNHHGMAHKPTEALGKFDKFQSDLIVELIQKLADTPEGDGSMLDNTVVLYGCSNSKTHVNRDYPIMLVGGEGMGLKHGKFHQFGRNAPPLSNLYLSLLTGLGVPAESFSDSTGTLSELV